MTFYIDNLTTYNDLEDALEQYSIKNIKYNNNGRLIWDRDVAIWALGNLDNVTLWDVAPHLANSARVVLAAYIYSNDNIKAAASRFQNMSYNELYNAAMLEHLEDPEEHWSYDIKHKLIIDRDFCTIHMFDQDNEIWRMLDSWEINELEDDGLYYFIGYTRSGERYNLRTGEIIG